LKIGFHHFLSCKQQLNMKNKRVTLDEILGLVKGIQKFIALRTTRFIYRLHTAFFVAVMYSFIF
jgi:hypothetical protein